MEQEVVVEHPPLHRDRRVREMREPLTDGIARHPDANRWVIWDGCRHRIRLRNGLGRLVGLVGANRIRNPVEAQLGRALLRNS